VRTLTPARRATDGSFVRFSRATFAGVRFARALGHAPQLVDQLEHLAQSLPGGLAIYRRFPEGDCRHEEIVYIIYSIEPRRGSDTSVATVYPGRKAAFESVGPVTPWAQP